MSCLCGTSIVCDESAIVLFLEQRARRLGEGEPDPGMTEAGGSGHPPEAKAEASSSSVCVSAGGQQGELDPGMTEAVGSCI